MRENTVKSIWARGEAVVNGWLSIPSSFSAEVMAHQGFDSLVVDMQHGVIDYQTAVTMLQAISTTSVIPLARVPWNDPAIIMKALDAGAYGVIVPLLNSRADVEAAVAACRYPPLGIRSYGPLRAAYYAGPDYFANANQEVCCIPMIETRSALEGLDDLLSVPGVDAVYVGPADLSLSLGLPPGADNPDAAFGQALERILDACRRHQVVPGIAGNVKTAVKRLEQGFLMVEVAQDAATLARSASRDLREVRRQAPEAGSRPISRPTD